MFERYTENARQVIFFARYEVSQVGASTVEAEHLLLGLLRADKSLFSRFLPPAISPDVIRKQVEDYIPVREEIQTSTGLPLSITVKNALAHAHEEADALASVVIGTEHILLGLLREDGSFAAKVLGENGVGYAAIRQKVERQAR
jgi:ATP-dependent Clp protease ATP-binding subunit ClpC